MIVYCYREALVSDTTVVGLPHESLICTEVKYKQSSIIGIEVDGMIKLLVVNIVVVVFNINW